MLALAAGPDPAKHLDLVAPTSTLDGGSVEPLLETLTVYLSDLVLLERHVVNDSESQWLASHQQPLVLECSFVDPSRFVVELRDGPKVLLHLDAPWPDQPTRTHFREVGLRVRSVLRQALTPPTGPPSLAATAPQAPAAWGRLEIRLGAEYLVSPRVVLPMARFEAAIALGDFTVGAVGGGTWPATAVVETGAGTTVRAVLGLSTSWAPARWANDTLAPFGALTAGAVILDLSGQRSDTGAKTHQVAVAPVVELGAGLRFQPGGQWYFGARATAAVFPLETIILIRGVPVYKTGSLQPRLEFAAGTTL